MNDMYWNIIEGFNPQYACGTVKSNKVYGLQTRWTKPVAKMYAAAHKEFALLEKLKTTEDSF